MRSFIFVLYRQKARKQFLISVKSGSDIEHLLGCSSTELALASYQNRAHSRSTAFTCDSINLKREPINSKPHNSSFAVDLGF